jgi:hypothetical protein
MQSSGLKYNGVTNSQQEACKKPHVLEIISNQLREAGVRTNKEYNNVLVELLNDSSVSIRDYLQGEILTYLCAYMNYYCTEGDTFLILCMDNERAVELQRIVDERLERINRVTCMWSVGGRDKAANNETIHILVIGFQDLVSYKLLAKRKDFFKNPPDFLCFPRRPPEQLSGRVRSSGQIQVYIFKRFTLTIAQPSDGINLFLQLFLHKI